MTADVCPGRPVDGGWARIPDGRLLLGASVPREIWLQWRTKGIGSSDASAVLGLSRWTSPYEVWARKRGLVPPEPENQAMELGHLLEPVVVQHWSDTTGISIRRAGLIGHRDRPWQLASVDRLAACGGVVEAKTLSWRVAEEWEDGQTPDHAEIQVQHQLAVTGRDHAHVVGLQDGRTWLERTVARDDDLIADLTKVEDEFWHTYVVAGVEPPIDGSEATKQVLSARWPAAVEKAVDLDEEHEVLVKLREDWKAQQDQAAAALGEIDNQLRAAMGDATVGVLPCGKEVTFRRNGTFAAKRFAQTAPDVAAACTREKPALDVDVVKREHPDLYQAHRARVLRVPTI